MNIESIDKLNGKMCTCGKEHIFSSDVVMDNGAINELPKYINKFKAEKAFVIADQNTYSAAGAKVCELLESTGTDIKKYIFTSEHLEPDESSVGLAIMNFDPECDVVIGIGSGVINDISKIVANSSKKPYIIVATAPSMDGYASATSSVTMNGIKISLPSKCADVIIGDIDILCSAPIKMMLSGLGDMLAKYVSICEWRISNLINNEYYCPEIAALVRESLKKCTDNAAQLLTRDQNAVRAVFEGLILCGAAMKFADVSRPASGVEHYISHIWDMRGAEFATPTEFHGLQCALGTLISIKLYEKLKKTVPNIEQAVAYAENFDYNDYSDTLRKFLGKSAEGMIALEEKEQKYNTDSHKQRIKTISENWDKILQIIDEELPSFEQLDALFTKLNLPKKPEAIGIESSILPITFKATKDIRDKYVLSRLCWDLGIIDEIFD